MFVGFVVNEETFELQLKLRRSCNLWVYNDMQPHTGFFPAMSVAVRSPISRPRCLSPGLSFQLDYCNSLLVRALMSIFSDSSLCRTQQPAWSPGFVASTTWHMFLLACTGFQYASELSTRQRCLCVSVYMMQSLAIWLTCVCRPISCMVASNCIPRRLGLCWSRAPGLLPVSATSPSMDHEHGTVCQLNSEHQIRPCAPSSVISRPTCFGSSTVRPAPLWL